MEYTDTGLMRLVTDAQNEVREAARPYQERAAVKMKTHVDRLNANLRNLTPCQRKEVLIALRAVIDQYGD
ncbi:hypothetical protein ACWGLG_28130 [Streptomyces antimycoticus]